MLKNKIRQICVSIAVLSLILLFNGNNINASEVKIKPGETTTELGENWLNYNIFQSPENMFISKDNLTWMPKFDFSRYFKTKKTWIFSDNGGSYPQSERRPIISGITSKQRLDLTKSFKIKFSSTLAQPYSPGKISGFIAGLTLSDAKPGINLNQYNRDPTNISYGKGNGNVNWQISIGQQRLKTKEVRNVIFYSQNGSSSNLVDTAAIQPGQPVNDWQETTSYEVSFNAKTRMLLMTCLNPNPTTQGIIVPKELKFLSLSGVYMNWPNNQVGITDYSGIDVQEIDGEYEKVKTRILYRNAKGEKLGDDSFIEAYPFMSITNNSVGDEKIILPEFKGFKARPVTFTTGVQKEVIVQYDYDKTIVPIRFIDDETNNKIKERSYTVTPYKPYNLTNEVAKTYVPKNYVFTSVDNASGVVNIDVNGNVSNAIKPIEIHVKHLKQRQSKTFTREIEFKSATGVVINLPQTIVQKQIQTIEYDYANQNFVLLEDAKLFEFIKIPKLPGYESDIVSIPEEKISISSLEYSKITVTYYYATKLNVPENLDFGNVVVGSLEYYGIKPKNMNEIKGDLKVETGNPKLNKWDVSVTPESDVTSTIFTINNEKIGIGDTKVIYKIDKKETEKQVLLLDNTNKDSVSMQVFNGNGHAALAGDKQAYTLTWALRNVPV